MTIPSDTLHVLSPHAHLVIKGFKDRRALCLSTYHRETNLFEIQNAEAEKAEAEAKAKPSKENKAAAARKRTTARNTWVLAQIHLNEHDGLGEVIARCEETEGFLLHVRHSS